MVVKRKIATITFKSRKKTVEFNNFWLLLLFSFFLFFNLSSCIVNKKANSSQTDKKVYWVNSISEFSTKEYPNNPDVLLRSKLEGNFSHSKIKIEEGKNGHTVSIYPNNNKSDTFILRNIELINFIPSVPTYAKKNSYLTKIGVINQEWNRLQVEFLENQFQTKGNNLESKNVTRVDLSKNCLNAYLWEIVFYATENEKEKPCYHGWFEFPKELYKKLFEKQNKLNFEEFKPYLEEWKPLKQEKVNLKVLRTVKKEKKYSFVNENDELYPINSERKKKSNNILSPFIIVSINDFLTDNTAFASFVKPGLYDINVPRETKLSRLNNLREIKINTIISNNSTNDTLTEIVLYFSNKKDTTQLIVGGFDLSKLPRIERNKTIEAYQMPMGIGNYTFYPNYTEIVANKPQESPFYSFLLDKNSQFIDHHDVGVDGTFMLIDFSNKLHFWILSYERNTFVGHYTIDLYQ